ncbi:HEAT repeat domain-containing protein [bacterium]|nr:HEAT repeat domain-containing protein [bacterium]
MGRSRRALIALLVVLAGLGVWFAPGPLARRSPEPSYLGRTVAGWETEIADWEPLVTGWGNKTGRWTWWARQGAVAAPRGPSEMPLLCGDPAAVPVLTALLASRSPRVRVLAAEGLGAIGGPGHHATPSLVRLLDDADPEVRRQAEQTLLRVDPEVATGAGVRWAAWEGIARR